MGVSSKRHTVKNVRARGQYVAQIEQFRDELEVLGISFDARETAWSEQILPALVTFREVFGHRRVPRNFVVPHAKPWPKKAWGLHLDFISMNIHYSGSHADKVSRDSAQL